MALSFGTLKKAIVGGAAALTVSGAMTVAAPTPAEAQGMMRPNMGGAMMRPNMGGGRFVNVNRNVNVYNVYGRRGGGFGRGAAFGTGLLVGGAFGALAGSSYYPYGYGYGSGYYPATYATPVYYGGGYGYGGYGDCWIERRVRFTPWGERIVRRVQVCS